MKNLSFNRIWQLIRYYWRTEKKLYLRLFLGLVALYLIIGLILHIFAHLFSIDDFGIFRMLFNEEWIFWGFILICTARMFYVLEKKQTATTFLSLPASNIEKYLSRVFYATIGIYLLALAARLTANTIFCIPLFFDENWPIGIILRYKIFPSTWIISSIGFNTPYFLLKMIACILWATLFAIWPWSLFTLFGLLFRRHGWLWAIPALFIIVSLFAFVMFTMADNNWNHQQQEHFMILTTLTIIIPTIFNYWLAYRCFCHAQVISNKLTRL